MQADLNRLPFASGAFDLEVSVNVINHGDAATFRDYCRELARVLKAGGHLFIYTSPREAGERVRLPQTRELEPGTLVDIATPDGAMVHHFPTPAELREQFPGFTVLRQETIWAPIPFMENMEMPQLIFWGEKGTVGSGTDRRISVPEGIYRVRKYSGRQPPPFFTFQSDTSPSLFSEYTIFARCSISSSFVERDRTLH